MRNIYKVREAMLEVVEDKEVRERIRIFTESTMTSARYAAPEIQGEIWIRFCKVLETVLPPDEGRNYPWFPRFVRILRGDEDAERGFSR